MKAKEKTRTKRRCLLETLVPTMSLLADTKRCWEAKETKIWRKLEDRVRRGVGNPCPLLLIGLPAGLVTFGEPEAVVERLIVDGEEPSLGG